MSEYQFLKGNPTEGEPLREPEQEATWGKPQQPMTADRIREAAAPRKETPPELPPMEQMEMAALTGTDPELPPEWRHTDG